MEVPSGSLTDALEGAITAATHLTGRDAPTIAAVRMLARKIDAWDVIVEWALDDVAGTTSRPAVPANDNTSLGVSLKYMEALQLMPAAEKGKPGPESTKSPAQQAIDEMRKGLRAV